MKKRNLVVLGLLAIILVTMAIDSSIGSVSGAEKKYPSRTIELICQFPPGGALDPTARFLAKKLEKRLNVPVIIVNKPGGGGVIAATALVNSAPDGYTLHATLGDTDLVLNPLLGRATYKREDFRVIGEFVTMSTVMAVSAESPWKTIQEFVDYARKNPGLSYGHPGVGSSGFIRGEYFNKIAKLNMRGVPFKGDAETIAAILGGHVPITQMSGFSAKLQEKGGKMRILLCLDPDPDPEVYPNVPSISSAFGIPDLDAISLYLVAPGKTPEEIVKVLERALEEITKDPEFIADIKKLYFRVRFTSSKNIPQFLERKTEQIKPILMDAGLIK